MQEHEPALCSLKYPNQEYEPSFMRIDLTDHDINSINLEFLNEISHTWAPFLLDLNGVSRGITDKHTHLLAPPGCQDESLDTEGKTGGNQ
jgi:hypothetical protein